jgi:N-acetylmuramoyl-L-alanine amidase
LAQLSAPKTDFDWNPRKETMSYKALSRCLSASLTVLAAIAIFVTLLGGAVDAKSRHSAGRARPTHAGSHRASKPSPKKEKQFPIAAYNGVPFAPTATGPLSGKFVIIDPGHGGKDSGAEVGSDREKDINLSVALKLVELLRAHGAKVVMTRADDTFIELDDRAGLSNKLKPDIFLSVHTNANDKTNIHGVEAYYYASSGQPLAQSIADALVSGLSEQFNWVEKDNLRVLDQNTRVASLAEIGYLTYGPSRALLMQPSYQQKIADSLYKGVENYFKSHP